MREGAWSPYPDHPGRASDELGRTRLLLSRSWRRFPRSIAQESGNPRASPGGTPEPKDASRHGTLAREALEENQVRIAATTAYLGYQKVLQPGHAPYAQVRMAGITEFAPRAPDADNGELYRRLMTSLAAAPGILGWGEPATAQARATARHAHRWGIPASTPVPDGYQD